MWNNGAVSRRKTPQNTPSGEGTTTKTAPKSQQRNEPQERPDSAVSSPRKQKASFRSRRGAGRDKGQHIERRVKPRGFTGPESGSVPPVTLATPSLSCSRAPGSLGWCHGEDTEGGGRRWDGSFGTWKAHRRQVTKGLEETDRCGSVRCFHKP